MSGFLRLMLESRMEPIPDMGLRVALLSTSGVNLKKNQSEMRVKFIIKNFPEQLKGDVTIGYIGFCQLKPKTKEVTGDHMVLWHITNKVKPYSVYEVDIKHYTGLIHMSVNDVMNITAFVADGKQAYGFFVSFLIKEYDLNCRIQVLKQSNVDFEVVAP